MSEFGDRVKMELRKGKKVTRVTSKPTENTTAPKKRTVPKTAWKKGEVAKGAKPWPKGFCPNPGGRPAKTPTTDAYREMLLQPHPNQKKYPGMTWAQVNALRQLQAAEEGDIRAQVEITDRVEGKVPQGMRLDGPGGGAIPLVNLSPKENEAAIAALLAKAGQK